MIRTTGFSRTHGVYTGVSSATSSSPVEAWHPRNPTVGGMKNQTLDLDAKEALPRFGCVVLVASCTMLSCQSSQASMFEHYADLLHAPTLSCQEFVPAEHWRWVLQNA